MACSTGYALANLGKEYLVLQPDGTTGPFTLEVDAGSYTVEWYSVISRETQAANKVTVERASTLSLTAPFAATEPAVVYLRKSKR